jgi:hypothetical protein
MRIKLVTSLASESVSYNYGTVYEVPKDMPEKFANQLVRGGEAVIVSDSDATKDVSFESEELPEAETKETAELPRTKRPYTRRNVT